MIVPHVFKVDTFHPLSEDIDVVSRTKKKIL